MLNIYKDFLHQIRRVTLKEPYLAICVDILPTLTEYFKILNKIEYEDGFYHVVYGSIKKVIYPFIKFYSKTIDVAYIEADKFSHLIRKEELLELWQKTIQIDQCRQIEFGKNFLPVTTAEERAIYDEIEILQDGFTEKLLELRSKIERFDRHDDVFTFAQEHFELSLRHTKELFEFTHIFLSRFLFDNIDKIRVSLEEILLRMKNNLKNIVAESEENLNTLLNQLYDKNKELLVIQRKTRKCSLESAEVDRAIQMYKNKIKDPKYQATINRLEEEIGYWQKRLDDFNEAADPLLSFKEQLKEVEKQEKIYETMRTTELPGSKRDCWLNIGKNYKQRRELLQMKIAEGARCLVTFFCVRGTDRIFYTDHIGPYYMDEQKHQVYLFNNGLNLYHQTCEGRLHEVSETVKYFIDRCGRFIIDEEGKKVYQVAPCSSHYKLTDNGLLKKVTKDCGHSEKPNLGCKLHVKDATDIEILPSSEKQLDIKATLTPEVVKYLWDSFGHVLPFALHDVAEHYHKNPIHLLAHKLVYHKYNKTIPELNQKKKEAEEYRTNVYKERKEKAMAASRAWKAKQVKRRKPEESDDAQDWAIYDFQTAELQRINTLNFYND